MREDYDEPGGKAWDGWAKFLAEHLSFVAYVWAMSGLLIAALTYIHASSAKGFDYTYWLCAGVCALGFYVPAPMIGLIRSEYRRRCRLESEIAEAAGSASDLGG